MNYLILLLLIACDDRPSATATETDTETSVVPGVACDEDVALGSLDTDGDGVLTPEDLSDGQAVMRVAWTDADGTITAGLHLSEDTKIIHGDYYGNNDHWAVWFKVTDSEPESAAFVWFEGPEPPLTDGSWEIYTLAWDVPPIENGGDNTEATGNIQVTVGDDVASGMLYDPTGPIEVLDYVAGGPTGETVEICEMAFRKVYAELD